MKFQDTTLFHAKSGDFSYLLRLLEDKIEKSSHQSSNNEIRVGCEMTAAESLLRRSEQNDLDPSEVGLSDWPRGFLCSTKAEP